MLIAEELLLLVTDDGTGKLTVSSHEVDVALGGALLIELTLMQRVDVAGEGEHVRQGRLVVKDAGPTGIDLLDEALEKIARKQGKKPQDVVTSLVKTLRPRLYERLAKQGVLSEQRVKTLGLFPATRWPAHDSAHEEALRRGLETALRNGLAGEPRTAALVSLLHALKAVHKAISPEAVGMSKHDLNASAKRISEGDWASAAVRKAIESINATVAIAAASGAVAATGSS